MKSVDSARRLPRLGLLCGAWLSACCSVAVPSSSVTALQGLHACLWQEGWLAELGRLRVPDGLCVRPCAARQGCNLQAGGCIRVLGGARAYSRSLAAAVMDRKYSCVKAGAQLFSPFLFLASNS